MPEIDRYDESEFVDAGRAQAEAEIADWLEGQAAGWERLVGLSAAAKASALLAAAEAVRQGRARREGA